MSGPQFRDYHLLLDEQGDQIFAMTDAIAERVRKVGGTTLRSIGHVGRLQRLHDNDADYVTPLDMLAELREDNIQLAASMRETHATCEEHGDVASTSLLESWIDETERRTWFLRHHDERIAALEAGLAAHRRNLVPARAKVSTGRRASRSSSRWRRTSMPPSRASLPRRRCPAAIARYLAERNLRVARGDDARSGA